MRAADKVARFMFAEPFRPFRVVAADGRVFPVRDAHMPGVSGLALYLDATWADESDGYSEQKVRVPFAEIVAVEPLDAPASGS